MRIPYLRLANFRSLIDAELEIGDAKLISIRGGNHRGKTSIRQGISMLLTPTTEGLDPLGRGFVKKIKRGTNKAELSGIIEGNVHRIKRTVTLNTNSTGREDKTISLTDPDWHPLPFERALEVNRDALRVCLNTEAFLLSLDEAQQKKLLSSLVLPSQYTFPTDKIAEVERLIGQGALDFTGNPFEVIEKGYKKFYKERQTANQRVSDFSIPDALPIPQGIDSGKIDEQLRAARVRRQSIAKDRDAAVAGANSTNVERGKLETRLQGLEQRRREEEGRLQPVNRNVLTESRIQELQAIIGWKLKRDAVRKDRAENTAMIDSLNDRIEQLESLHQKRMALCPTCSSALDYTKLAKVLEGMRSDLANRKTIDVDFVREEAGIGDIEGAESQLRAHVEAMGDKKAIESKIGELAKQITKARNDLAKLPAAVDAAASFAESLKEVDAEIQKLETDIRPAIIAEGRAEEITTKTTELEALRIRAKDLDAMVKWFDKDGIKAKLLGDHMGSFTDHFNQVLKAWGYSCSFSIEPYEFNVTTADGITSPVSELSDSEKLMFSIAMQCAVSSRIENVGGLVVCDRMDTLLPEERAKANACLYGMLREGVLDEVFVISSDESQDLPDDIPPRTVFFTVENGYVKKLEAKAYAAAD